MKKEMVTTNLYWVTMPVIGTEITYVGTSKANGSKVVELEKPTLYLTQAIRSSEISNEGFDQTAIRFWRKDPNKGKTPIPINRSLENVVIKDLGEVEL